MSSEPDLMRMLRARRIAVVGGGAWAAGIVDAATRVGFDGDILPVHPKRDRIAGLQTVPSVRDIDGPIDAAFIGVNRAASVDVVADLARHDAGGAVAFASGFAEASGEDAGATALQKALVTAAGRMPVLGPNCYGFVNALDRVAIWPDQHGMTPVDRGVAILTQSSNIAINLTMQQRGLPIGYMITCGNQAMVSQADLALAVLDDPRVTALGVHIEGFGDVARWWAVAERAAARGIPVLALKVGASEQAQRATVSHTASLAGSDAGAEALLRHLGSARARDLPTFLETLKLMHVTPQIDAPTLSSISCSGGEASLVADMVLDLPVDLPGDHALSLPPLTDDQQQALRGALGPQVALANPLDYHTYIWRDVDAMTRAWMPMTADHIGMTLSIVDYPVTDATDWDCATQAALNVAQASGRPFGVVASLPELMPGDVAARLLAGGVVPFSGLTEALRAVALVAHCPALAEMPPLAAPPETGAAVLLDEMAAKQALSGFGVQVPQGVLIAEGDFAPAQALRAPLVLKGLGLAHKTDQGAVRLGLVFDDLIEAAKTMPATTFLVEEMVPGALVELLVGIRRDPAHGFVLTLGAGGVQTEIWRDTVSRLLPVSRDEIRAALNTLRVAALFHGFRNRPAVDLDAVVASINAVQTFAIAHADSLLELEINPLLITKDRVVAVDALIRKEP